MSSPSRKSPSRVSTPHSPSSAAHHASPSHHTAAAGSAFGSGSQYLMQLCTPARIFAGIALFQLVMHIIEYSGLKPLFFNLAVNLFNIWFLNFLCDREYSTVAWIILVLFVIVLINSYISALAATAASAA